MTKKNVISASEQIKANTRTSGKGSRGFCVNEQISEGYFSKCAIKRKHRDIRKDVDFA